MGVAVRCKLCNATCQCIQFFCMWDKILTPKHPLSQAIWSCLESEGCHLTPLPVSSLVFLPSPLALSWLSFFSFWQSILPTSSQNIHQHFSLQVRLFCFCIALVKQIGDDSSSVCSLLPYGAGKCHYPFICFLILFAASVHSFLFFKILLLSVNYRMVDNTSRS